MPHEILFRERYGTRGQKAVYIKPPDQNALVRLGSAVTLSRSFWQGALDVFRDVFLPQGYPESVSDDYWNYQKWDTIQAFCSTISGALTTQAIMKGVGVGSNVATPLGAAITWILKDGTGMIGRIAFAWWKGTCLDADCKKWRLCADALNDIAMCLELSLPYFSLYSTEVLCFSTTLKAIVGVAGGATRAAITQHQAVRDNMADVSAKDGSQETCVNLAASLVAIFILSYLYNDELVWYFFIVLAIMHLYSNYKAVKSLKFNTLNEGRLLILLHSFITGECITPSPECINDQESVILGHGLSDKKLCGFHIILGASLKKVYRLINAKSMKVFIKFYREKKYFPIIDIERRTIYVSLRENEEFTDIIEAYFHAVLLGITTSFLIGSSLPSLEIKNNVDECPMRRLQSELNLNITGPVKKKFRIPIEAIMATEDRYAQEFELFFPVMQAAGWNMINHHIRVDEWRGNWTPDTYVDADVDG